MWHTKPLWARVSQSTRKVVRLRGPVSFEEVERRAFLGIVDRVSDKVVDQVGVVEASRSAVGNKVVDHGVRNAIWA
jgi:hypothetical protein